MRQRDHDGVAVRVAPPDELADALQAEQPPRGEAADRDDEPRADQLELPFAPERAEVLLARRRRPVAAAGGGAPGITARDGRAVEAGVELVLVELEPAPQAPAGAAAPGPALLALDDPWRLAEHVGALSLVRLGDGERLDREACLEAGAADAVVALEGAKRAVARPPSRHPSAVARSLMRRRPRTSVRRRPCGRRRAPRPAAPARSSACTPASASRRGAAGPGPPRARPPRATPSRGRRARARHALPRRGTGRGPPGRGARRSGR